MCGMVVPYQVDLFVQVWVRRHAEVGCVALPRFRRSATQVDYLPSISRLTLPRGLDGLEELL